MKTMEQDGDVRVPLALTEALAGADGAVSEAEIRGLVDWFYEAVRGDGLLGPVFEEHVADWSMHLPKMYDFWSTVVLRSGRYAGRPIEAHLVLRGLTQGHFDRWLELWRAAVEAKIGPGARRAFVLSAERMAGTMAERVVG